MDPSQSFVYPILPDPKTSVRLITDIRKDDNGTFHCALKVYKLTELPPYLAFSYEWGPPRDHVLINVNSTPFMIRPNLASFLSRAPGNLDCDALLFVDTICLYFDRYGTDYLRNLRFGPLFSEGLRFYKSDQFIYLCAA